MPTDEIHCCVDGQSRSDRLSGGAKHHRGPPLLCDELLFGVIGLVQQRDPQILTRRSGAVSLDDGLERLTGHDWPVQQQLVLTMDPAACLGKHGFGDELEHRRELGTVCLCGDGGRREGSTVEIARIGVEGCRAERCRTFRVDLQVVRPRSVPGIQHVCILQVVAETAPPGRIGVFWPAGQPPVSVAPDQHVHRHLRKRLPRVRTGWQWFTVRTECHASDVRHHHLVAQPDYVTDLVAELGLLACTLLEADVDRVKTVVPVDERSIRAAPCDVGCELEVQDVGVPLIMASLKTGPESFHCSSGIRTCDPHSRTGGQEDRPLSPGRRHAGRPDGRRRIRLRD